MVTTNADHIEDALAEALARTWIALERGRQIDSLEAWVFVVASNEIRRAARRRGHELRLLRTSHQGNSERPSSGEVDPDSVLIAAVRALPARQRDAVLLHYWFDLRVRDVAAALDIAEGTAKALLHQGRAAIRSQITTGEPDERFRA